MHVESMRSTSHVFVLQFYCKFPDLFILVLWFKVAVLPDRLFECYRYREIRFLHSPSVMRPLTTGICIGKCIIEQFHRCVNIIECTYTNLGGIVYHIPRLQ